MEIKITAEDRANGLAAQVQMLSEQVSRLLVEKAAQNRVLTEIEVAEAAKAKEPAKK